MDALNVWSVLFIVACFLFMQNIFIIASEMFVLIGNCLTTKRYDFNITLNAYVASFSFTYIMAFLFIW